MDRRHFLLLAKPPRDVAIAAKLLQSPYDVRIVHEVDELLIECLQSAPLAVFVDLHALTRIGTMGTAPLFDLAMDWPVMRCAVQADGGINVLCADPGYCGPILPAMEGLAGGDPFWRRPMKRRRSLRLEVQCRARLRRRGAADWSLANATNVSNSGAYLITFDTFPQSAELDVEILDLLPEPVGMRARIVWTLPWNDSASLPGVAVAFDEATVPQALRDALARPDHIERLKGSCQKPSAPPVGTYGREWTPPAPSAATTMPMTDPALPVSSPMLPQ